MKHTDKERMDYLETKAYTARAYTARADVQVVIGVMMLASQPAASLRIAIDRALDSEQDRESQGAPHA
jgi:hypothetical protein